MSFQPRTAKRIPKREDTHFNKQSCFGRRVLVLYQGTTLVGRKEWKQTWAFSPWAFFRPRALSRKAIGHDTSRQA
jgi:hypothetical protein